MNTPSFHGRRALVFGLVAFILVPLCTASALHAAIIVTPPGKAVSVVEEKVFVVFDPLTGVQSTIVRHGFEETAFAFGLLLPVPAETKVQRHSNRLRRVIERRLYPTGRVRRSLEVDFVSWLAGCATSTVGDPYPPKEETGKLEAARGQHTALGSAPERLHDWLLTNGFTVSPAQSAWIEELRHKGWSLAAFVLRPPEGEHRAGSLLYGPVISLTHPASELVYAAYQPPFALFDERTQESEIEFTVLSEWAVTPESDTVFEPFYASTFSIEELVRLRNEGGRVPWSFRRAGILTGYKLPRPKGDGVLRFRKSTPFTPRRPKAISKKRAYRIEVPMELAAVALIGLLMGIGRFRRRSNRRSALLG